jgi:hypothetical protein
MGIVTWENRDHRPAPSIEADSYNSVGICFNPARKISIGEQIARLPAESKVQIAVLGSPNHDRPGMPRGEQEIDQPIRAKNFAPHNSDRDAAPTMEGA